MSNLNTASGSVLTARIKGFAGVAPDERPAAVSAARILEWPMLFIALWIIATWVAEAELGALPFSDPTDWLIWGFFLLETLVLTTLVEHKTRYLRENWVNLVIISLDFPFIWETSPVVGGLRALRLLVLFGLVLHFSKNLRTILARNNLGQILMACFVIIIIFGTLMALFDPAVKTPFDGIWWAWVTVTTVGYGDIVPSTIAGRLLASILILMGVALFSLLIASISAFFVSEEEQFYQARIEENRRRLEAMEKQLLRMEEKIDLMLSEEQKQILENRRLRQRDYRHL